MPAFAGMTIKMGMTMAEPTNFIRDNDNIKSLISGTLIDCTSENKDTKKAIDFTSKDDLLIEIINQIFNSFLRIFAVFFFYSIGYNGTYS
jgi:hypothetical protein